MSNEEKAQLKAVLHEYADVFSKSEYDLGCTSLAEHTIDMGDARPIKQTLRRQPLAHLETIDKQVGDMLKTGIIDLHRAHGFPKWLLSRRRMEAPVSASTVAV